MDHRGSVYAWEILQVQRGMVDSQSKSHECTEILQKYVYGRFHSVASAVPGLTNAPNVCSRIRIQEKQMRMTPGCFWKS